MKVNKVVIPAAGLGTRLLPATKEQPKEMLPIFAYDRHVGLCVKPLLQMVFEQLFDAGFREFCFVIGRGKRAIEDHFTPDYDYVHELEKRGKEPLANSLRSFYERVEKSIIIWVNQPSPRGFGDAVLQARPFVGDEEFLVHAGDTYIISDGNRHLFDLARVYDRFDSDAAFLVLEVEDPRQYGVIEGRLIDESVYLVDKLVEKPEVPPTNLAIMPVYLFNPIIFKAIEVTPPGKGGEIQLTDGIQKVVDWGLKVHAVPLKEDQLRLDIGSPKTYWEALTLSYNYFSKHIKGGNATKP